MTPMNLVFMLMAAGILQFIGTMILVSRCVSLSNQVAGVKDENKELRKDLDNVLEWLRMLAINGGNST